MTRSNESGPWDPPPPNSALRICNPSTLWTVSPLTQNPSRQRPVIHPPPQAPPQPTLHLKHRSITPLARAMAWKNDLHRSPTHACFRPNRNHNIQPLPQEHFPPHGLQSLLAGTRYTTNHLLYPRPSSPKHHRTTSHRQIPDDHVPNSGPERKRNLPSAQVQ